MQRLLSTIITVLFCAGLCFADSGDSKIDFLIKMEKRADKPIYRVPAKVPVQGYYVSMQNTLYLSFTYYVGEVDVEVQNLSSGECSYGTVSSDEGTQAVPLFDNGSFYRITLTTSGGTQYEAEFQL